MRILNKKILLFLFIFSVIFIAKFPIESFASTAINNVYISGIDEPVVGANPDTTGTTGKGYSIDGAIDWYDETNGNFISSTDTFIIGHVYRADINVSADNNYIFNSVSDSVPNVTAYVNNKVATANKRFEYKAWAGLTISYRFDLSILKTIRLSGGELPAVGAQFPNKNSWYVPDGSHYTKTSSYNWYDVTNDRAMNSSYNTFKADNIYRLTINFEPEDGYSFDDPGSMTAILTDFPSSEYTAVVKKDEVISNNSKRYVEFTFNRIESQKISIDSVAIKGGAFPYKGENPDYTWSVPVNANYNVTSSSWYSPNENRTLNPADTFTLNQTYYLDVYVAPNTGYYFKPISEMTATLSDITGSYITQIFESASGTNRMLRFIFTATNPKCIVRFESNGGTEIASQTVDKGSTITRPNPVPTKDGYTFVDWYVGTRLNYVYDFNKPVTSNFTLYAKWAELNSGNIDVVNISSNNIVEPVKGNNMYIPTVNIESVTPSKFTSNVTLTTYWSHNYNSIYESNINSGDLKFEEGNYDLYILMESNLDSVKYNYENFPDKIIVNGMDLDLDSANENFVIYRKTFTVLPFTDVPLNKWYTPYIKYVYKNNIMTGYNATTFAPDNTITRGQIATMLYRLAGQPDTTGLENPFADVPTGKYYTEPVKWAFSNGITTGKTSTSFDPDGNVTRQELAVFMARYSKEILGNDITSTYDITGIVDYGDLSTWARSPMQYIMEKGIITGDMKLGYPRILPRNNATRAEAATMFMRFCEEVN